MRLIPVLVLAALSASAAAHTAPKATLGAFRSEAEFEQLLARWRAAAPPARARLMESTGSVALAAAPAAAADSSKAAAESITNVQTAGVDEGGIVKRAGDHLVILRRGRLFTVRVGDDQLRPVAAIEAFAPGSDPAGAWYDELLIHDNTVVVVGYSYVRGGTEIGLFELSPEGALAYRATHHLKSHDYYSARNYASRLVGSRLVFYSPLRVAPGALTEAIVPQWRRWSADAPGDWQRILPATRIYRTDDELDPAAGGAALHTVTSCDLSQPQQMRCEASAVLAPPARVFYVSAGSVYVWTTESRRAASMQRSAVFRLPLDGSAPSALKTTGSPIDQLSFLEDVSGHLNVLLRADGRGEGMWNADRGRGQGALLRVPLSSFGHGRESAPRAAYRALPSMPTGVLNNRYVGEWLLFGSPSAQQVQALRYTTSAEAVAVPLAHGVERIEALGADALLAGRSGRDLHFTSLRLADEPVPVGRHVQADAAQGETRTHGFFYRALAEGEGLLGLPVVGGAASRSSASVLFLRQRDLALQPAGQLRARAASEVDDQCRASCVDWYGNARPIFLGEPVLALMGYELVEGRLRPGWAGIARIEERRRVDFAPRTGLAWGRD